MRVEIASIPPEGLRLALEGPASILGLAGEEYIRIEGPVTAEVTVRRVGDHLVVEGAVEARSSFCCSRCGEFFVRGIREREFRCTREVSAGAEFVDLTPDIRESILLNFPAYPLCGERCRGLCPYCGTNLNTGQCGCKASSDLRWGGLDAL